MNKVIVLVANDFNGFMLFRIALINELLKSDNDVHLICPKFNNDHEVLINKPILSGLKIHQIDFDRKSLSIFKEIKSFFFIFKEIKKIGPEVVFSSTIKVNIYSMISSYILRIKKRIMLVNGLGTIFRTKSVTGVLQRFIQKAFYFAISFSTDIIFQNLDDKNLLLKKKIMSPLKEFTYIKGSGVDVNLFSFKENIVQNKSIHFLMASRLLKSKGVREYFQACKLLHAEGYNFDATLIGDLDGGPDAIEANFLSEIKEANFLNYYGYQIDVIPFLKRSNIFVLPSYHEGLPKSCIEALSVGRPVITTNAPGCRDVIIDGKSGLLIEAKSSESLFNAMQAFINNQDLIKPMSMNARNYAVEQFDLIKINKQYLDIINS